MVIEKLIEDLRLDEGVKHQPYLCTAEKLTIGVGRNLDDVGISDDEINLMLHNDIKRCHEELDNTINWWREMPEPAQRALCNMCFNLGITRLLKFKKMLAALEQGNYTLAAKEALDSKWANQVGERAQRIANLYRAF